MGTDEEDDRSPAKIPDYFEVPRGVPDYAIEGALEAAEEEDATYAVVASDADYQLADTEEELREVYFTMKSSRDHLTPEERGFSLVVVERD